MIIVLLCLTAFILSRFSFDEEETAEIPAKEVSTNVGPTLSSEPLQTEKPPTVEAQSVQKVIEPSSYSKPIQDIWSRYQMGDYQGALSLCRQYLQSDIDDADRQWIQRQRPIIQVTLAWQLVQTNRCEDAVELFYDLLDGNSETAKLAQKGSAVCSFRAGSFVEAEMYAKNFIEGSAPDEDINYILLESLESNQKFEEAIAYIDELIELSATSSSEPLESFKTKRERLQKKYQESLKQTQIESQHFRVFYRPGEHEQAANWATTILETAMDEFRSEFSLPEPSDKLIVYFYSAQTFSLISHGPRWAKGLFDGRIRIPLDPNENVEQDALQKILRHELTHALLSQATQRRRLPSWFNEGLSIYLECPGGCRQDRSKRVFERSFLSQEELEQSFLQLSENQAVRAYEQSLYLIQTLVRQSGTTSISRLVENLPQQGPLTSDSLLKSLGIEFSALHTLAKRSWQKD